MFVTNYILIYIVLYNICAFAGQKYLSIWLNPVTYLFLIFCYPVFIFMPDFIENHKMKIHAQQEDMKRIKEEVELYGIRTTRQVVIDLKDYEEDRDIPSYQDYYQWQIEQAEKPDRGIPHKKSNKI